MVKSSMACREKVILLKAYRLATEAYMDSVTVLCAMTSVLRKLDYDRIRLATDILRNRSEEARLMLESHTDSHDCYALTPVFLPMLV
jgi:hypothetical protein